MSSGRPTHGGLISLRAPVSVKVTIRPAAHEEAASYRFCAESQQKKAKTRVAGTHSVKEQVFVFVSQRSLVSLTSSPPL